MEFSDDDAVEDVEFNDNNDSEDVEFDDAGEDEEFGYEDAEFGNDDEFVPYAPVFKSFDPDPKLLVTNQRHLYKVRFIQVLKFQ